MSTVTISAEPKTSPEERKALVDAAWLRFREAVMKLENDRRFDDWTKFIEEEARLFEKFKGEEASILRQK